MDQGGAVPDVLIAHQRLVVSVSHSDVAIEPQLQCLIRQGLWGEFRSVDRDIPLHLSRFFPRYRMMDKLSTPVKRVY